MSRDHSLARHCIRLSSILIAWIYVVSKYSSIDSPRTPPLPSPPPPRPDLVDEDKMLADGVSRFCEDANLDPTSLTVLIIAWKFKAATQCEFSRKEFVEGMAELG